MGAAVWRMSTRSPYSTSAATSVPVTVAARPRTVRSAAGKTTRGATRPPGASRACLNVVESARGFTPSGPVTMGSAARVSAGQTHRQRSENFDCQASHLRPELLWLDPLPRIASASSVDDAHSIVAASQCSTSKPPSTRNKSNQVVSYGLPFESTSVLRVDITTRSPSATIWTKFGIVGCIALG
jgi:hypothetical protein